jgi:hypothetical protein
MPTDRKTMDIIAAIDAAAQASRRETLAHVARAGRLNMSCQALLRGYQHDDAQMAHRITAERHRKEAPRWSAPTMPACPEVRDAPQVTDTGR